MVMTIGDVAEALEVSKGTVSRAITGNGRISPATRQRVLDYMTAHDFHPNTIAQSLSRRKTMNLAFTIPTGPELIQLPFFLQALVGADGVAGAKGYDILIVNNTYADVQRVVSRQKVDGVIVSRNLVGSRMLGYLAGAGLPFVLIGTSDHPGVLQIDYDHHTACREFTAQLLQCWDGKPGLIAGPRAHLVTRARAAGFADAAPAAPIVWEATDEEKIVAAFHQLRAQGVTSVFCEDDMICGYLENNLQTGRLGVDPASVQVASFYDSPLLEALNPAVPVIHFDSTDLGARACSLLLASIAGQPHENVTLPYQIVLRGIDTPQQSSVPSDGESHRPEPKG